ncbi:MAG TPA: hypothetical protein VMM78_12840 [Thermomicrobiales bacterium]|nr:hypothetical protein [Thermomicrobiales bacterium]
MSDDAAHDTSCVERNRQQLARMKALVERLSDEELRQPIGEHWSDHLDEIEQALANRTR